MDLLCEVDAYCAPCKGVQKHAVVSDDPGACYCNRCGSAQVLISPAARASLLAV